MSRMIPTITIFRFSKTVGLSVIAFLLLGPVVTAEAQTVHSDPLFELGDGVDPAVPGIADILGSEQPGPDWDDLFNADRSLRDQLDEMGNVGANGVPDFLDSFGSVRGRRDASFILDDISGGSTVDATAWIQPGVVGPSVVPSGEDLGNVYAYGAINGQLESVLYLGAERLETSDGRIVFELNREPFSIEEGGAVVGGRSLADIQLEALFVGGVLTSVELRSWEVLDAQQGILGWMTVESLPITPDQSAEQCDPSGSLCVVCNGVEVGAGSWPSYDEGGLPVSSLQPDSFIEIGLNLSRILGHHTYSNYYQTRYVGFQVSTDADYASGTFSRAARAAGSGQPAS